MKQSEVRYHLAENGFCAFPEVLSHRELTRARDAVDRAMQLTRQPQVATHIGGVDANIASEKPIHAGNGERNVERASGACGL